MKQVLSIALCCAFLATSCGPGETPKSDNGNESQHFGSLQIVGFQTNVPPQDGPGRVTYNFRVYKDGEFVKYDMTGFRVRGEEHQEHSERNVGQFGLFADANIFGFEEEIVEARINTEILMSCAGVMPYIDVPNSYSRSWSDESGKANVNLTFNFPVQTILMEALNYAQQNSENCSFGWSEYLSADHLFTVIAKVMLRYRLKSGAETGISEITMVFQS